MKSIIIFILFAFAFKEKLAMEFCRYACVVASGNGKCAAFDSPDTVISVKSYFPSEYSNGEGKEGFQKFKSLYEEKFRAFNTQKKKFAELTQSFCPSCCNPQVNCATKNEESSCLLEEFEISSKFLEIQSSQKAMEALEVVKVGVLGEIEKPL